jgi:hypothetical protein
MILNIWAYSYMELTAQRALDWGPRAGFQLHEHREDSATVLRELTAM